MSNYDKKILHIFYIKYLIWCKSQSKNFFVLKWIEITLMLNYDKILHIFLLEIVDIMLKSK
jgi:hypothetical protein